MGAPGEHTCGLDITEGDACILSQWCFIPISLIRKTKAQVFMVSHVRRYLCPRFTGESVGGGDG